MSVSTTTTVRDNSVRAFVNAQVNLVHVTVASLEAESMRQDAFTVSAIAARDARKAGVTLQKLADANKAATAHMADSAPRGTLYVALASVTVHAFTGDILALGTGEDDAPIVPTTVQTLVSKVYKAKGAGTSAIGKAVKGAKTQAIAIERLNAALDALKATDVESDGESGESDESGQAVVSVDNTQSVETLLARALSMIGNGAIVSEGARGMIAELSAILDTVDIAA